MMLSCLSRRVLGLNSSCRVKGRWLRFDVMGDFLDYVWVSDVPRRPPAMTRMEPPHNGHTVISI